MFRDDIHAGNWADLVDRLDAEAALARWAEQESALAGLTCVQDVVAATSAGSAPELADKVLGALVRVAANGRGTEQDAVLLLLHLLSPGIVTMTAKYAGMDPDLMAAIVSELAARIVAFPWRHRHRAVAANLLLDTRAALFRELRPRWSCGFHDGEELPVDPQELTEHIQVMSDPGHSDVDLGDLLAWAAHEGVAPRADLHLLVELETVREHVRAPRLVLAAAHGINERTVRRRRDRALRALRQARGQYLAAVA